MNKQTQNAWLAYMRSQAGNAKFLIAKDYDSGVVQDIEKPVRGGFDAGYAAATADCQAKLSDANLLIERQILRTAEAGSALADCLAQLAEAKQSVAYWNNRMAEEYSLRLAAEAKVRAAVEATIEEAATIFDTLAFVLETRMDYEEARENRVIADNIRDLDASAIVTRVMHKEEQ